MKVEMVITIANIAALFVTVVIIYKFFSILMESIIEYNRIRIKNKNKRLSELYQFVGYCGCYFIYDSKNDIISKGKNKPIMGIPLFDRSNLKGHLICMSKEQHLINIIDNIICCENWRSKYKI